jgi:hypothetical protein
MPETDEGIRTWLVQRLNKPFKADHLLAKCNPFSFGGGYLNGGLTDEAMDLLRPILDFDYMGAAEFEWGAVPKTFAQLKDWAIAGELVGEEREIQGIKVFLLCHKDMSKDAWHNIELDAKGELSLKEPSRFRDIIDPPEYLKKRDWEPRTFGWLEIDNHFVWTVDENMEKGFRALFLGEEES